MKRMRFSIFAAIAGALLDTTVAAGQDQVAGSKAFVRVVVGLDTSSSMRGFNATMQTVLDDITKAADVRGTRGAPAHVELLSVRDRVTPLDAPAVDDPAIYRGKDADLLKALESPQLVGGDMSFLITDGQPTPPGARTRPCSYEQTVEVSTLADWIEGALERNQPVWILVERLPFDGEFYLNCGRPLGEQKGLLQTRGMACDPECHYRYKGERTLLTIVTAKTTSVSRATDLVAHYLDLRSRAEALRLDVPPDSAWIPRKPIVSLYAPPARRSNLPVSEDSEPGSFRARIECRKREFGFSVCLDSVPAQNQTERELSLVRVAARQHTEPPSGQLMLELPRGTGLVPSLLDRVEAWQADNCASIWNIYEALANERQERTRSACELQDRGEQPIELIGLCGCRQGTPDAPDRQMFEIVQSYEIRRDDAQQRLASFGTDEERWVDQPDRIHGLDSLVGRLATYWEQRGGTRHRVLQSLRLEILTP